MIGWTWPAKPAVPDSIRGTPAVRHILLTCRLASTKAASTRQHQLPLLCSAISISQRYAPMLSSAPKTRPKRANQSESNVSSLMLACRASIEHLGLNWRAVAAATDALGFEMSGLRKRNCRLRFERSIVSRSTWKAAAAVATAVESVSALDVSRLRIAGLESLAGDARSLCPQSRPAPCS
jgi:hypothetical protein